MASYEADSGGRTMRPNFRSISGAALMLVILPIFAGLLACMPEYVPLGNPERARIDENMSGLWFVESDEDLVGTFVFLEPWDKRTWLVTNVVVEVSDSTGLEGDALTWTWTHPLTKGSPNFLLRPILMWTILKSACCSTKAGL